MSINLRKALPEDAETCGTICYEAFKDIAEKHNFPPDLNSVDEPIALLSHLFARNDIYNIVAEDADKIIGSNVLWENGEIAGVGPITVDPIFQGSVGRLLMEAVLQRANEKGFESIRLVQAAFNNLSMSLYSKLGFDVREPLSVMQGPSLELSISGCEVRPVTEDDVDACNQLCKRLNGYQRAGELREAIQQKTATLVERDGRISGYATVVGFWGHSLGENNEDLKALIAAAPVLVGPGILLPSRNAELLRWCLSNGLRIRQPMTLMSYGSYMEPVGVFLPSVVY